MTTRDEDEQIGIDAITGKMVRLNIKSKRYLFLFGVEFINDDSPMSKHEIFAIR